MQGGGFEYLVPKAAPLANVAFAPALLRLGVTFDMVYL